MDFLSTWEKQLEILELQSSKLRELISLQKSAFSNSPTIVFNNNTKTKAVIPVKNNNDVIAIQKLFEKHNRALTNSEIEIELKNNPYLLIKRNKPEIFSIVKFNNENRRVYWVLSDWIKDGKISAEQIPVDCVEMDYEINPEKKERRKRKI